MAMSKILVVDDSPAQLEAIKQALQSTGAIVISAKSGVDAVNKCKAEKPDMVFMDIVMDDVDGYNACRQICKNEATKDIPVVFVTTKNQRADRLWADRQGGRGLITKPFTEAQILEQVARFS